MSNIYGDYIASEDIRVSQENHEVITNSPEEWTTGYKLKKMSFVNMEECTVKWKTNNDRITTMKLPAGVGLEFGYDDPPIVSFIIVESGISYLFVATY